MTPARVTYDVDLDRYAENGIPLPETDARVILWRTQTKALESRCPECGREYE